MAEKRIRQRIELHGEKEYNQALKDAQRNLKTLQTALKAETAELGKNASEQDKARVKAESLRKQIAEQEKIVKTLQEALAQARKEYGDNEAEIARWEQKLNNARATLAGMKNDLGGVGDGMQQISTDAAAATVATKSVADALGEIGGAGDAVAGAIEGIFQGMIDTVSGAVSELWEMISGTAARANEWSDIAGYWGTDAQTIQQYARAVSASANSFEDLQGIVSKLVLGGKGEKIAELIGISDVNYKNEWDYAMAAMDQLYKMQQRGENMNPIYEQLFGEKKSTKVMDLVNDWGTIMENLPQFNGNETGYGMSDEELETMNDLWVQINKVEEKWLALKENFAAGFGVGTMELLVNVEGTLDGLAAYMNAKDDGEKQAALAQIRTNIEEFFRKVADIIRESLEILRGVGEDLQKSDDPMTRMVGNILTQVADALQWFVDNQEAVKGAFNAIFGIWLLAKLAAVAGKLGDILLQIEAIKAFKGLQLGGEVAKAAGDAASGGGGGGLLAGIVSKFTGLVKCLGGGFFGQNNLGMIVDWFTHNTHLGRALSGNETWIDVANAGFEYVESVKENAGEWADTAKGVFNNYAKFWDDFWKPEGMGGDAAQKAADTLEQVLIGNFNNVDTDDILDENGQLTESARKSGLTEEDIGQAGKEPAVLAVVEPEAGRKNAEEARLRQALAAENEANARAAQAEAEARERNRNPAEEPGFYPEGIVIAETETEREEPAPEEPGFSPEGIVIAETEPESADALEEAAGSLEKVGRVLGGIVIAETEPEEETIDEDLDDLAAMQAQALEDLFDAWRGTESGEPGEDEFAEFDRMWDFAQGIFGDAFGEVIEQLIQKMDENPDWTRNDDIPPEWLPVLNSATWNQKQNGSANENGITRQDLAGFNALPGNIRQAVENGARKGVSGIQVSLDGFRIGQLVAPYVSEMIARDFIV